MTKPFAVKLNEEQREALIGVVLPGTRFTNLASAITQVAPGRFLFQISEDDADKIRELCMDRFQDLGIGPDGEPNKTGMALEDLTDLFFIG